MYITTFEVVGKLSFPMDMLRYDCCYPSDTGAAGVIESTLNPEERSKLLAIQPGTCFRVRLTARTERVWYPTRDRWASFLWSVDPESVQSRKL